MVKRSRGDRGRSLVLEVERLGFIFHSTPLLCDLSHFTSLCLLHLSASGISKCYTGRVMIEKPCRGVRNKITKKLQDGRKSKRQSRKVRTVLGMPTPTTHLEHGRGKIQTLACRSQRTYTSQLECKDLPAFTSTGYRQLALGKYLS